MVRFTEHKFDSALNLAFGQDKSEELREFFGVETNAEVKKIAREFRDKASTKKINLDFSTVQYEKCGNNEYVKAHEDNIIKEGTIVTGDKLLNTELSTEQIEPPMFVSDKNGNIWKRIK
jgi:hypothetical protein